MQLQENLFQFKTLTLGKHLRIYMCWAVPAELEEETVHLSKIQKDLDTISQRQL